MFQIKFIVTASESRHQVKYLDKGTFWNKMLRSFKDKGLL